MGTVTTTNQLFFLSFVGRNTAVTVANDEHFLHRNKHETTRGRGFFHLFLMSSALSVGKLLLWNLFSFPFSDSTARSPDIHQNYSSLGLFFV